MIGKLLKEQAVNYTKVLATRLRCKPKDVVHMIIEASQLIIYWSRPHWWISNNGVVA
jgi:hypothetical protein